MSKPNRIHAPGCVIHITARTQGREPWFTEPLRARVMTEILAAGRASGHSTLALVVMPNHFHIVVTQGPQALSAMMHRVMHRCAVLLRCTHRLEGHVFERRYWSGVCANADFVRATIAYVHLNPWRAQLCSEPGDYMWSSHRAFVENAHDSPRESLLDPTVALRFFQSDEASSGRRNYLAHVNYQMNVDRFLAGQLPSQRLRAPSPCTAGNAYWTAEYAAATPPPRPAPKRPLYDVARALLVHLDPRCPLDLIRSGTHARPVVTIRRDLIAALLTQGYGGVALARFFGVSPTLVSRIRVSLTA